MDYIVGGMEMNFVVGIDFTVRDSRTSSNQFVETILDSI